MIQSVLPTYLKLEKEGTLDATSGTCRSDITGRTDIGQYKNTKHDEMMVSACLAMWYSYHVLQKEHICTITLKWNLHLHEYTKIERFPFQFLVQSSAHRT